MLTSSAKLIEVALRQCDCFVLPDKTWRTSVAGTVLCPQCFHLLRTVAPAPLDIPLLQLPDGVPYSLVFQGGAAVIRTDLLAILQDHLPSHMLGRCLRPDGNEIGSHRTIYFTETIWLRGDRGAAYWRCRRCDFTGCVADQRYVLRGTLPDAEVYQDHVRELYFAEVFGHQFPWRDFPELRPVAVEVRDAPRPDDPWPRVERVIQQLTAAFSGRYDLALAAVEESLKGVPVPENPHKPAEFRVEVRGVPVLATVWWKDTEVRITNVIAP